MQCFVGRSNQCYILCGGQTNAMFCVAVKPMQCFVGRSNQWNVLCGGQTSAMFCVAVKAVQCFVWRSNQCNVLWGGQSSVMFMLFFTCAAFAVLYERAYLRCCVPKPIPLLPTSTNVIYEISVRTDFETLMKVLKNTKPTQYLPHTRTLRTYPAYSSLLPTTHGPRTTTTRDNLQNMHDKDMRPHTQPHRQCFQMQ